MDPAGDIARFEFYRLRFHFEAHGPILFPVAVPANILRGAFGSIIRRAACTPDCIDPRTCLRRATCEYARTFAPAASRPGPSGLRDWPRPFVFRAAHLDAIAIAPGDRFHFDVILFQIADPPIGCFLRALSELSTEGLGPKRSRATLLAAEQVDADGTAFALCANPTPTSILLERPESAVNRIVVRFITPAELKAGEQIARRPEFHILLSRVRDRVSTLSALYGRGPLAIDFAGLGARAATVRLVHYDLRWVRASRRSSRTGERHPLGGFVGVAEYEGDLAEFVPLLRAAQVTGVGRQTSWGKGEIEVQISPEFPAGDAGAFR